MNSEMRIAATPPIDSRTRFSGCGTVIDDSIGGNTKMAGKVNAIPTGYHSITPYLVLNEASRAIEFYKQAFDAKEISRMGGPAGKIGHAELKIGDSMIMLSDEMPGGGNRSPQSLGGSPVSMFLYVENVDSVFDRAVKAGAKADMPPQDMFWGDRFGKLTDPFGHQWALATHIEDVAPAEMDKRAQAFMAQMAQSAGQGS
jgi:PhnB protein